jgi:hypothetical protein
VMSNDHRSPPANRSADADGISDDAELDEPALVLPDLFSIPPPGATAPEAAGAKGAEAKREGEGKEGAGQRFSSDLPTRKRIGAGTIAASDPPDGGKAAPPDGGKATPPDGGKAAPSDAASPFDRVTSPPPMPPHEYVAYVGSLLSPLPQADQSTKVTVVPSAYSFGPMTAVPAAPRLPVVPPSEPTAAAAERRAKPAAGAKSQRFAIEPGDGSPLALVGARAALTETSSQNDEAVREMRDRFAVGDFTGSLASAEAVLRDQPEHAEASRSADECRRVLRQMYLSRLGGPELVPTAAMHSDQMRWLSLDHHSGFLLSLIDGRCTIEELIDMSGMPELDALRILVELLDQTVIRIG